MPLTNEHLLLAVYRRDTAGQIEYSGLQEWPSLRDFESAVSHLGKCMTRTEEMLGWPDSTVHWLLGTSCAGDTGYVIAKRISATY